MDKIVSFLSGQVPGGIILLLLVLLVINLVFIFFTSSRLISRKKARRDRLIFSFIAILVYISLWFVLRPPLPQERIIVLPARPGNGALTADWRSIRFPELFQRAALNNLEERYLLHRWQWLLETVNRDSLADFKHWWRTARRMGAALIIVPQEGQGKMTCSVYRTGPDGDGLRTFEASADQAGFLSLIRQIDERYDLFLSMPSQLNQPDSLLLTAQIDFHLHRETDLSRLQNSPDLSGAAVLRAKVFLRRGLEEQKRNSGKGIVAQKNSYFEKAAAELMPLVRQRKDTPQVAFVLGRLALREEEYNKAEIYLKKAMIDDPANARVYYALSYLLPERLADIGYKGRAEILERALYYDPGYRSAVYRLANHYYISGTGTHQALGTSRAIATIERFLQIQHADAQILSLLGSLYLKTMQYQKARHVFERLYERFPEDSNASYNLGVVHYMQNEYQQALPFFEKAVSLNSNADACLYLGVIHHKLGHLQEALKYYRQRVRQKSGDDDPFAREAMKGIRNVLAEMEAQKQDEPSGN